MKPLEKIALFVCLLLSVLDFVAGGKQQAEVNAVAHEQAGSAAHAEKECIPTTTVLYGEFQRCRLNGRWTSYRIDGIEYEPGRLTPSGTVLAVTEEHVHIRDDQGNDTFIYPRYETSEKERNPGTDKPSALMPPEPTK